MASFENFPQEIKRPEETKGPEREKSSFFRDPLIEKLEKANLPAELIKEVEDRLVDSLTKLPRPETAKAAIDGLIKEGKNVVVEFNDLRYLKVFNKTIGFEKTNELLKEIGEVYRKKVEEFNKKGVKVMVSRYGGDEFLIIIGEKNKEEAQPILKEIQYELRKIQKPPEAPFGPKFSTGIVSLEELPFEKRSSGELIELADKKVSEEKKRAQEELSKRGKRTPAEKYQATKKLIKQIRRYAV